jgi:uncharacterized protein (DUF1697 family)
MTRYVALLRAVNVGGTGKLPMAALKAMCADAGFLRVETYIASGNVVFDSEAGPDEVRAALEERLLAFASRPVGVVVRTAGEMAAVLSGNPFQAAKPANVHVIFLCDPPPGDALLHVSGLADEELHLGGREIYVHYPSGMGRSKLRIPAAKNGTARNLNTAGKLASMASAD